MTELVELALRAAADRLDAAVLWSHGLWEARALPDGVVLTGPGGTGLEYRITGIEPSCLS